mgnify:CR=1 FL=1
MKNGLIRLRTYTRLGVANLARVARYKIGLKTRYHPVQRLSAPIAEPAFFRISERHEVPQERIQTWNDAILRFGWHRSSLPNRPPDWFANPFSNAPQPRANMDWWQIPDFGAGDIKGLWELSRLDWVLAWASAAAQGDLSALQRMNIWLADWAQTNPPYKGPNWKCGQEASIRVMHLVTAAWILGQHKNPEPGLVTFLATHLQRIAPTMSYAIGQQNNHGTSEAAALFLGGSFLFNLDERAVRWEAEGRRWLESLASNLIETDGSFSQYSVTYHRLMLDTYSLAEAWRRNRKLPAFSKSLMGRLAAATDWLWSMVDARSGDAPNIGANDGARLLSLDNADYRDFRPSVQLAAVLFGEVDAFGPGPWNATRAWLNVPEGKAGGRCRSRSFDSGGYHVLRIEDAFVVMRYPRFNFRPSQQDALHVDLWHMGNNLLRDAGTFSYNADCTEWFAGPEAHNTIVFDRRDQMPRLGRFLLADWLKADAVEKVVVGSDSASAAAGYSNSRGARHYRRVYLNAESMVCIDTVCGKFTDACLRWRLAPLNWKVDGLLVRNHRYSISIEVDGSLVKPELRDTIESRYYQYKSKISEISVSVKQPATITTKIHF